MDVGFKSNDLKNIVFIYDNNPILDIFKCIKIVISANEMQLINIYKNNYIINCIPAENESFIKYEFLCYIEDLKNIFSIVTDETKLYIKKVDEYFIYFSNDGSDFKIPVIPDDFPSIPQGYNDISYKVELSKYNDSLKNILMKSNNQLSEFVAFKITGNKIYALNTDNYRIHSVMVEQEDFIPNFSFTIPHHFIELIGKYNLDLYIGEDHYILKNNHTIILLEENIIINKFKKAFQYLDNINANEYLNKFTINKSVFLNELKKHLVFSKDIYLHIKPHTVVLYSKSAKIINSDIKTISHAYNLDFNEHQTVLIDLRYFIDFIKAHNENTLDIFINRNNFVYSSNNLCATKRM